MTQGCSQGLLFIGFLSAWVTGALAGDLTVVSVVRFENGNTFINKQYRKGERIRREWRDHALSKPGLVAYGPPRAAIYQCDSQRAIELNLRSREYAIMELNEECQSRNAPPPAIKGVISVYIDSIDTGERRQILGRTARHIMTHQRQVPGPEACWPAAEMDLDGWYVDKVDKKEQEADSRLRRNSIEESALVVRSGANCRDKIEVHRTGVEKLGFPLLQIQTSRFLPLRPDGTTTETTTRMEFAVTELTEALLDPSLFELPAGFNKVARIDACPDVAFSAEVKYWWHRAVSEVRSWF